MVIRMFYPEELMCDLPEDEIEDREYLWITNTQEQKEFEVVTRCPCTEPCEYGLLWLSNKTCEILSGVIERAGLRYGTAPTQQVTWHDIVQRTKESDVYQHYEEKRGFTALVCRITSLEVLSQTNSIVLEVSRRYSVSFNIYGTIIRKVGKPFTCARCTVKAILQEQKECKYCQFHEVFPDTGECPRIHDGKTKPPCSVSRTRFHIQDRLLIVPFPLYRYLHAAICRLPDQAFFTYTTTSPIYLVP